MINTTNHQDRRASFRIIVVGVLLACVFGIVISRSIQLHLLEHGGLKWIAKKQYKAVIQMAQRRGKIVDVKGRELASSVPVQSIFADPSAVVDPAATLDAISEVLPLDKQRRAIDRRMKPDRKFVWIQRRVAADVAEQVKRLNIPGVHFVEESLRVYPNGELASQVLGAVGYDAEPLAGIEMAYDDHLRSKTKRLNYRRDARGRIFFSPVGFRAQDDVGSVRLTIDKIVQYTAEQALGRSMERTRAKGAMAIVVDVHTGQILAMANRPTFNPNEYYKFPQDAWRNRAVTDAYEPGSTFKVLVVAAALEAGFDATREYDCEMGRIKVGTSTLHDHGAAYGMMSMHDIIKKSSNIGTYKIARSLGKAHVAKMIDDFQMGHKLGLDYPGEVAGIVRDYKTWQPIEFATIAFGQGVAATPLQMTMAFAAIANGGELMKPYLVEEVRSNDGTLVSRMQPEVLRRVMQSRTASMIRTMLQSVVAEGGTGPDAASQLYDTAGKTGTAQKIGEHTKGYARGKYFSSFVGFAPAQKPRIAVFVGIDEPKGAYYGGAIAGPVFREIVEATLQYLEVPTTGASVLLATDDSHALSDQEIKHHEVLAGNQRFTERMDGNVVVPDLRGLSVRHVIRLAREVELPVKVKGSGVAIAQRPTPGTVWRHDRAVEVKFALPQ